jgi:hypothetical protein
VPGEGKEELHAPKYRLPAKYSDCSILHLGLQGIVGFVDLFALKRECKVKCWT